MARRATYFFDVHKTTSPLILVSGAWEYMRPGSSPTQEGLKQLADAFNLMSYDIGLVSKAEAQALDENGVVNQDWQQTATAFPYSIVTKGNNKIGFYRLPPLPQGDDIPSPSLIERISNDIARYRSQVRLLVALSDWGWVGEREYLAQNPKYVPDFLFGSGRGSGVNGRLQADGRCVWVRPYDKGRTVAEITIFEWPVRENSFAWDASRNYKTTSIGLNDSIKDYPAVNDIFQ